MLTPRENFLETIRGGSPDRYVNQYEALGMIMQPIGGSGAGIMKPGDEIVNPWGVTMRYPVGTPAAFPVHDEAHKVLKDITQWRDVVKAPPTQLPESAWERAKATNAAIDRSQQLAAVFMAPGIFEQVHYLMGMEDALVSYYEEPEAMQDLIDFLADFEVRAAEQIVEHLHPDAVFHHDDWGSHISSFLSPEMFRDFFLKPYQKVYGFFKANGVEVVCHHNDSYSANLVPTMIDMGIDVWQGPVDTNDLPKLLAQYGPKLTLMGGLNNGKLDVEDWTPELISGEVERICRACGTRYFIPCMTAGLAGSVFPGVYECVSENVDRMSKLLF